MMPSGTLLSMAEGPYVAKEPGEKSHAAATLTAAEATLQAMKGKTGDGKDSAEGTLLAYQTMYQCAKALAQAAGYRISNFRALVSALETLYVKPGKLDQGLVEQLLKAQAVIPGTAAQAAAAEKWVELAKQTVRSA